MQTWQPPTPSVIIARTLPGLPQGIDLDTDANNAFTTWITVNAVAAQNSTGGISNANGSGKTVYIDGAQFSTTVASNIRIGFCPAGFGGVAAFPWRSMKAGGADAVASPRALNQVGTPDTIAIERIFTVQPVVPYIWKPARGPIELPPNSAFMVGLETVNSQLQLVIYGREY